MRQDGPPAMRNGAGRWPAGSAAVAAAPGAASDVGKSGRRAAHRGGGLAHHSELDATHLDHVPRLELTRLAGEQALPIHECPAGRIEIEDRQFLTRHHDRRLTSRHPPRRIDFLLVQVEPRPAVEAAAEDRLGRIVRCRRDRPPARGPPPATRESIEPPFSEDQAWRMLARSPRTVDCRLTLSEHEERPPSSIRSPSFSG